MGVRLVLLCRLFGWFVDPGGVGIGQDFGVVVGGGSFGCFCSGGGQGFGPFKCGRMSRIKSRLRHVLVDLNHLASRFQTCQEQLVIKAKRNNTPESEP